MQAKGVPVIRRALEVNPDDVAAARQWLQAQVEDEVRQVGQAPPRIVALGEGWADTLPLDIMGQLDPGAHLGATYQALKARAKQAFAVITVIAEDHDGGEHPAAICFQQHADQFWVAILPFFQGEGKVEVERWSVGEGNSIEELLPPLRMMVEIGPENRPARMLEPTAPEPDVRSVSGELPDNAPIPKDAGEFADFTGALTITNVLKEGLGGALVVRLVGRTWQLWSLGDDLPVGLDDAVRAIAARGTPAEGVAILIGADFGDGKPGLQIISEKDGRRAERRVYLAFQDNKPKVERVERIDAGAVGAGKGWLGVAPSQPFDLAQVPGEA